MVVETAQFFDNAAATWDKKVQHDHKKIRCLLDDVEIRPGHKILDVGTGTGVLLPLLLERIGMSGTVQALDVSPRMIERARQKCKDIRVSFLVADIEGEAMETLPREGFDSILCYSVFPHFSSPEKALKNMFDLLSPGGRLAVMHSDSRETINERHRRIGGPVGGHELPSAKNLKDLGLSLGYVPEKAGETPNYYLVVFKKPEGL